MLAHSSRDDCFPVKTTMGVASERASCMGVMTLVALGPDVTSTTPGFPVARAYPMMY